MIVIWIDCTSFYNIKQANRSVLVQLGDNEQITTKETDIDKPCDFGVSWRLVACIGFTDIRNPQRYTQETVAEEKTSTGYMWWTA